MMKHLPATQMYINNEDPSKPVHRRVPSKRQIMLYRASISCLILLSGSMIAGIFSKTSISNHYNNETVTQSTIYNHSDLTPTVPNLTENVKFGFTPTTTSCLPKHIVPLGNHVYVSVCKTQGDVTVDIRYFMGSASRGIYPTIKGIALNTKQFKNILTHSDTILNFVKLVHSHL